MKKFQPALVDIFDIHKEDTANRKGLLADGGGSAQLRGSDTPAAGVDRPIQQMIALVDKD